MKPARFEYVAAKSLDAALAELSAADGAQVLAGGQSLVPLMCQRLARPRVLVDVTTVAGLDEVVAADGMLRVGAACRHRQLERHAAAIAAAPAVAEAASLAGPVHVRNRGTIGGSLANADPAAELPAALLAAGASVRVAGHDGARTIPLGEFALGPGRTALRPGEMVVRIDVPVAVGSGPVGGAFSELAPRAGDLPIAGAGCTVRLDSDGVCTQVLLAACGVGSGPVGLAEAASPALGERRLTRQLLAAVAAAVAGAVEPADDARASADQRREAVQIVALEALARAWQMAGRRRGLG